MGRPYAARNVGRESWRHRVRRPRGVVVMASGGLDSCVLVAHEAARGRLVFPLFIRSGLNWEGTELRWLRRFLRALPARIARRVRPIAVVAQSARDLYGAHWSTTGRGTPGWRAADNAVYLPGRNILLLAAGSAFAAREGIPRIAVGPLAGNPFPDASPAFFRMMQRALAEGLGFPIRVEAPFQKLHKAALIRKHSRLPLHLTFSCSRPARGRHCGACAKCRERILAFREAQVEDAATRNVLQ